MKQNCKYSGSSDKSHGDLFNVTQVYMINNGDDQALMELLDQYGPVSIAIDASSPIFSSYQSGIFASPKSPASPMCKASNIGKKKIVK